jgi:hypothetical protein
MANIPQLRAVLRHKATRSAWTQPLVVVYRSYVTNSQGALFLLTGYQRIRAVKIHVLSYLWYTV